MGFNLLHSTVPPPQYSRQCAVSPWRCINECAAAATEQLSMQHPWLHASGPKILAGFRCCQIGLLGGYATSAPSLNSIKMQNLTALPSISRNPSCKNAEAFLRVKTTKICASASALASTSYANASKSHPQTRQPRSSQTAPESK